MSRSSFLNWLKVVIIKVLSTLENLAKTLLTRFVVHFKKELIFRQRLPVT